MPKDIFSYRKATILQKSDKSYKGSWDLKILDLCKKINKTSNYYTTSSCSGRAMLMIDAGEKGEGLFLKVWHVVPNFEELKKMVSILVSQKFQDVKFKTEPPILHVVCQSLEDAQNFIDKSKIAGWKNASIIYFGKRIVVELTGTGKLEFPVIHDKLLLISDKFWKVVVKETREKMLKSWEIIDRLEKEF